MHILQGQYTYSLHRQSHSDLARCEWHCHSRLSDVSITMWVSPFRTPPGKAITKYLQLRWILLVYWAKVLMMSTQFSWRISEQYPFQHQITLSDNVTHTLQGQDVTGDVKNTHILHIASYNLAQYTSRIHLSCRYLVIAWMSYTYIPDRMCIP